MDVTVALLEVSAALGILYSTLQAARYRDQLHDKIASTLYKLMASELDAMAYISLLRSSQRFARQHHLVSMWLAELPERFRDIKSALADHLGDDHPSLPWAYRWFRRNYDKYVVVTLATVLPVGTLWGMSLGAVQTALALCVAGLGQTCLLVHLLLGNLAVVHQNGKRIGTAVDYIRKELASQLANAP